MDNETTQKHPGGRPTLYSKDIADSICEKIAQGSSMRTVCEDESMPAMSTVFKWLREHKEFSEQYASACEERTEAQNELLLELGDEALEEAQNADPKAANAVVSAVKLKADNLKWVMSKQKPKKYGEKIDHTSGGEKIAVIPMELHAKRNPSSSPESDSK